MQQRLGGGLADLLDAWHNWHNERRPSIQRPAPKALHVSR